MNKATVTILYFPGFDPEKYLAKFDTVMARPGLNGQRAKNYLGKDGSRYLHICLWLEPAETPPVRIVGLLDITERVFFGKYRLAGKVEYYRPDTLHLISDVIEKIKEL